ncbi:NADH dehydrogenase [ubiquinone] 1 beta subcomplex subunit 1 [Colletes latitarsis]|uniref:NADH dehydrogenase [ubiquinone] 1 beta subcomplex subunit 1 n=1 Tax=Colletes latitarsis TaxID=2605962 RepID=UPI0040371365
MTKQRNLFKMYCHVILVVGSATAFGWWMDRLESERLTLYRDKSALFGRELKPGEAPSWP